MNRKKYNWSLIALFLILLLCIVISASVGSASITMKDSLILLLDRIPLLHYFVDGSKMEPVYETIIWKVRLPRILLASLVGGSLAVAGCTFQTIFRNPLADAQILGVSSGAALGATLSMLIGASFPVFGLGITGIFAFGGALITVLFVYRIGSMGGTMSTGNLLLTGTAVSTMLSAVTSLLMVYRREQLEKVYLWTLGSFSSATFYKVSFLAAVTIVIVLILMAYSRDLNVLLTGDEMAESVGIDTAKIKRNLIILSALLVAAAVSVSGTIGFVGLIIPHCMRLLVGPNHKVLLLFSFVSGAIFLILCDTLARTIAQPTELPVGIITALFGAPYFIYLLYRNRKKGSL